MLKKSIPALIALMAPVLLTGCPVYVDTLGGDPSWQSPDVVVVGENVPANIEYGAPTITEGKGDGNPIIDSFTQNIPEVKQGQPITFTVVAHDPNNRPMQFNWSSTGGLLTANTGRVVAWDPPSTEGVFTVTVVITNGNGGVATGSLNMTVHAPGAQPSATPAPAATPTPTPAPLATALPVPTPKPTLAPTPTPAPTTAPTTTPTATPSALPTQDAAKGSISGVVKDANGVLAGAEVQLTSGDPDVAFVASITTGANGAYRFINVPAGVHLVISAHKDGYAEKLSSVTCSAGQETSFNFDGASALVANQ